MSTTGAGTGRGSSGKGRGRGRNNQDKVKGRTLHESSRGRGHKTPATQQQQQQQQSATVNATEPQEDVIGKRVQQGAAMFELLQRFRQEHGGRPEVPGTEQKLPSDTPTVPEVMAAAAATASSHVETIPTRTVGGSVSSLLAAASRDMGAEYSHPAGNPSHNAGAPTSNTTVRKARSKKSTPHATTSSSSSSSSSTAAASSSSSSSASSKLYNKTKELEAKLQLPSATDPATAQSAAAIIVTALTQFDAQRAALQKALLDSYVTLLLRDPRYARDKRVDDKLWKVFYRGLDYFIKLSKHQHSSSSSSSAAAAARTPVEILALAAVLPPEEAGTQLRARLDEASDFLSVLVAKLIEQYALHKPEEEQQQSGAVAAEVGSDPKKRKEQERAQRHAAQQRHAARQASCFLSIALGDVERYRQLHLEAHRGKEFISWTRTVYVYRSALSIDPHSGKAHNQLAVVAMQEKKLFEAMYQYVRALSAREAFPARENLLSLYESNRRLLERHDGVVLGGGRKSSHSSKRSKEPLPTDDATLLLHRLVRLHGFLYTHVGLEYFEGQLRVAMVHFQNLLSQGAVSDDLLVRILALCVYVMKGQDAYASYAEWGGPAGDAVELNTRLEKIPVDSVTRKACALLYEVFGAAMRLCALQTQARPLVLSCALVCGWMVSVPRLAYLVEDRRCQYFRSGLAQLINAATAPQEKERFAQVVAQHYTAPNGSAASELLHFPPFDVLCAGGRPYDPPQQIAHLQQASSLLYQSTEYPGRFVALPPFVVSTAVYSAMGNVAEHARVEDVMQNENEEEEEEEEEEQEEEQEEAEEDEKDEDEEVEVEAVVQEAEEKHLDTVASAVSGLSFYGGDSSLSSAGTATGTTSNTGAGGGGHGVLIGIDVDALRAARAAREAVEQKEREEADARRQREAENARKSTQSSAMSPRFFVLDAPNIAMRHGDNKRFSTAGIQQALDYFRRQGHRVLAIMPDYYLDYEYVGGKKRMERAGFDVSAAKMPDNVSLLISLRDEGVLATTPPQDYDDSYTIKYAMKHNAIVVSNDKYRDHVEKYPERERRTVRQWLKAHVMTYMFVGDDFLPNPDFQVAE